MPVKISRFLSAMRQGYDLSPIPVDKLMSQLLGQVNSKVKVAYSSFCAPVFKPAFCANNVDACYTISKESCI